MADQLDVAESPVFFTTRDRIAYSTDTASYGGSPVDLAASAVNLSTRKVVTATVLDGSPAAVGDIINWPFIQNLVLGNEYEIKFEFVCGGQRRERRLTIRVI